MDEYGIDTVLIDTWWNVNDGKTIFSDFLYAVLIDTWWNVNIILEIPQHFKAPVLIDTWWNVNTLQSPDAKTDSTF